MHFPFQGSHSKLSPLERKNIYLRLCSNCNLLNLFICAKHNSFIQEMFTTLQGTGAIMKSHLYVTPTLLGLTVLQVHK